MTFIPRYTSNAEIQPGPLVDASPIYNAFATMFGAVSQEAGKLEQATANAQAKAQGAEAGMSDNFQPAKGFGEATQVYNQAGLEAQKLTLGSEVGVKISQLQQEASQHLSTGSIAQFNAALQGYGTSILQNTPAENRPYIQALLLKHGTTAAQSLQSQLQDRNNVFAYASGMEALTNWQNQAENAAARGDQKTAVALSSQAEKTAGGLVSMGLMPKGAYASVQIQNRKQLLVADVMGQYQNALAQGKGQEFTQQFLKSTAYDSVLSPMDKESTINHMQAMEKTKLQAAGITAETVDNTKKNILFQAANGQKPSAQDIAIVNAYDPDNSQNLQNDISLATSQHSIVQNAISGNLGQMQETVNALNQIPPDILKSDNAAKIALRNKAAAQQVTQYMGQLKTDPMQAVLSNPNVKQVISTTVQDLPNTEGQTAANAFIQNGVLPNTANGVQGVQTLIQKSAPAVLAVQRSQGVPDNRLSLMTNTQAAQIVTQVKQLPMPQQVAYMATLTQLYGTNIQHVLPALVKAGLPMANQFIPRAMDDPASASFVPDMITAYSVSTKQLEESLPKGIKSSDVMNAVKNKLSSYTATLQGYNTLSTPVINDIYNHANQLALQLITAKGQPLDKAAQDAVDSLVNNHYQYQTFNGQTYRVPTSAGVEIPGFIKNQVTNTPTLLESAIKYNQIKMNASQLKVPGFFYPGLPLEKRQELYSSESANIGTVVTLPDDSGLIFVDHYGTPIKTVDNKPFVVKFNDLNNLISNPEVTDAMNKLMIERTKAKEGSITSLETQ